MVTVRPHFASAGTQLYRQLRQQCSLTKFSFTFSYETETGHSLIADSVADVVKKQFRSIFGRVLT